MEYMPNFQLHRPETAEEAIKLLSDKPNSRLVAGGTDMIAVSYTHLTLPTILRV